MEIVEITRKELKAEVNELVKKANLAEHRWIYSYLKGLDDWPLIIDFPNVPIEKLPDTDIPEEPEEKCPYD